MKQLTIQSGSLKMLARINESPTAKAIWEILPVSGPASVWGDEIYFSIPVQHSEADNAVAEVEVGTLAYWPPGSAFCIFCLRCSRVCPFFFRISSNGTRELA